jgi:diacylglycerol kinase family enzyme
MPTQRKVYFLVNPKAGHRKGTGLLGLIEEWAREKNIDFEIHHSRESGGYPEIEKHMPPPEDTVFAVIGGDGTFRQVCDSLRHTGAAFAIVPKGSGNGLAYGAGIPMNPKHALELIRNGEAQWTDGLSVNGRFSCMLSGVGFDAAVAHEFARQSTRGFLTYARITLRHFFGARPYGFTIRTADSELYTRAFFISMANSNQFGNRFTIAPGARVDDGLMDVVVVNEMGKWRIPFAVLQQIRRGDIDEGLFRRKEILYIRASEIEVENPEMAPLHIDGDPAETSHSLKVKVLPRAFRLIRPSL